jgi:hypothetical protein
MYENFDYDYNEEKINIPDSKTKSVSNFDILVGNNLFCHLLIDSI